MVHIRLVQYAQALQLIDLGSDLKPNRSVLKLLRLMNKHAFGSRGRRHNQQTGSAFEPSPTQKRLLRELECAIVKILKITLAHKSL